jgi:multisubunit Na+/H+ antiporter MnhE subunit
MRDRVRPWLAWWLVLAALYLVLADTVKAPELAVGAIAAAVGATGAILVGRWSTSGRPHARWLAAAAPQLVGVFGDLAILARVLLTRGVLRRGGEGALVEVPFAGDDASLAWTQALGSLAPNTVVVDVDEARGIIVAHQLRATPDAASKAAPLP